jgi:hypothetical protein
MVAKLHREPRAFSMHKWCYSSGSSWMLPVVFTIELPAKMLRASFPLVHGGGVTQTWLSRSHKTLAPLNTITTTRIRAEGFCEFL